MSRAVPPNAAVAAPRKPPKGSRGQVLILYVMAVFVFIGMLAVVLDISWYWINSNRVQKAADAAALAGVVWLPGDEPKAIQTAIYEAAKNGYTVAANGVAVNGLTLTAAKQVGNDRRLNVSIRAPVDTFFMGLFGFDNVNVSRTAKAEYVLPVPMGSPENYYGVFGLTRGLTSTQDVTVTNNVTTRGWTCGSANTWPTSELRGSRGDHNAGGQQLDGDVRDAHHRGELEQRRLCTDRRDRCAAALVGILGAVRVCPPPPPARP